MKTIQSFLLIATGVLISNGGFAQQQSETFEVSGNCDMCEQTIEKAALDAGASFAAWDQATNQIKVRYPAKKVKLRGIQQKIADAGYDNAGAKASQKRYEKLPACCQYDRRATTPSSKK